PVMPKLIQELIGGDISQASQYGGWLVFSYAITQFFFASVLGNLSDRYGRRPILLISLLGFCLNYLLMGFAPSILWLFIGCLIVWITWVTYSVTVSYIADRRRPLSTSKDFSLLGAVFGLGFILVPVLGGVLGHYVSGVAFFAAAGLWF